MKKWNMIVDVARCSNCANCVLANKDEYVGNDFPGYTKRHPLHGAETIRIERVVRGHGHQVDVAYLPRLCQHCEDPPCTKGAGQGVVHKRDDGIVIIDPEKAHGRRELVGLCPFGAITWNEELNLPQNWIFDAHLLDQGWKQPRCAQVCASEVFTAVRADDEEMRDWARAQSLEPLDAKHPGRVLYRNLHRIRKHFLAGTVVAVIDGVLECLAGVEVELHRQDGVVVRIASDTFGDFKFDHLESGQEIRIRIQHAGYSPVERFVVIDGSVNLGECALAP